MGCAFQKHKKSFTINSSTILNEDVYLYSNKVDQSNNVQINQGVFIKKKKLSQFEKDYAIVTFIGKGSFGRVYKIRHRKTNQFRAVKIIKKSSILSKIEEEELDREIQILKSLSHPNIIKLYEYYNDVHFDYIVTEFCNGGELFDKISQHGNFSEIIAASIMKNILIAVNYFHSKSIVHRDLKPENILIEFSNKKKPDEFTIKIIDFGASKKFNRKSKIRDFVGTPYYIAPEVIKGTYDEKCDIWSCGVILFLMLTGTTPFDGVSENEIFKKVEKGIPQEKLDMLKNSSEEANNLIIRMLDLDPKKRMTAKEALESNWITDNESLRVSSFKGQTQDILNRLCNTRMKEKMQSAVISFLVNQLVSRDEINELRELFMRLDKNNDGRLSYNEIMHGYKEYYGHPLLDVKEIFEKIDSDKNGYISYEEFICEAIDLKKVMDDEKLKTCFDLFDNDKNGLISADEIKDFLACGNSGFTDEIWEKMVKEADVNGDGEISLDEFKQMMIVLVDSNVIKL